MGNEDRSAVPRPGRSRPFRDRPWWWGEEWRIGVLPRPQVALETPAADLPQPQWLVPPWREGYGCDPWVIRHVGRDVLFFEFYDRALARGVIAAGILRPDQGHWTLDRATRIIQEDHHLSHPCVFAYEGRWYMLPESADAGEVALYEATDFPFRWRRRDALLPGTPGLDPTFFQDDDRCWLFCGVKGDHENRDLHLFHAPGLFGPWRPHPGNPVVTARDGARPAGPLFRHDGSLLRPGQDSRDTYGAGIVLHVVETLTPEDYRERPVARLRPPRAGPFREGLHSLSAADGCCLVDGKRFTGLKALLGPAVVRARGLRRRLAEGRP